MRHQFIALCLGTALLSGITVAACGAKPKPPAQTSPATETAPPALGNDALVIATARGPAKFWVEVAATPEQQERGLMFRSELAEDEGMVFPFAPPRVATFWMKNTPIALDIIFIRADGTVARIAASAKPESLEMIGSGEPVAAVLEIAGGQAARQGIRVGDAVRWPGLAQPR